MARAIKFCDFSKGFVKLEEFKGFYFLTVQYQDFKINRSFQNLNDALEDFGIESETMKKEYSD